MHDAASRGYAPGAPFCRSPAGHRGPAYMVFATRHTRSPIPTLFPPLEVPPFHDQDYKPENRQRPPERPVLPDRALRGDDL